MGHEEAREALDRSEADPWAGTVPRQLVHRRSVADVLLTALAPVDETTAAVAAQWARAQPYYAPFGGYHDPSLVLETLRQAGLALCHHQLGVDADRQFLLGDLRMRLIDAAQLRVGWEPARLVLACRFDDLRWRGSGLRAGRVEAAFYRDGLLFGMGSSTFTCVDRAAFDRLRGAHVVEGSRAHVAMANGTLVATGSVMHDGACRPAVLPASVGRLRDEDVLLCGCASTAGQAWGVRVDPAHPFLFDHPNDHLPGMVVLEACRQAAAAATLPVLAHPGGGGWAIRYRELAPLGGLTTVDVVDAADGEPVIVARHGEAVVAEASFRHAHGAGRADRPAAAVG